MDYRGMKYLGAVTALGVAEPDYISFSEEVEGTVVISARSKGQDFQMRLPSVLVGLLVEDIQKNIKD